VWEFKQIKDLYLRIVAPRNLFIEFILEVRSTVANMSSSKKARPCPKKSQKKPDTSF